MERDTTGAQRAHPTECFTPPPPRVRVRFRVPRDQAARLPPGPAAALLPASAPLPRAGEVLYLSNRSAWAVTVVIHEWRAPHDLRVELCMESIDPQPHQELPH